MRHLQIVQSSFDRLKPFLFAIISSGGKLLLGCNVIRGVGHALMHGEN